MKSLVSIIIPIYNSENRIERCIESAIKQTYRNIEVILVDDGSIDQSGKICDSYARTDDRIRVIHKANGGVSNSRNVGLQNSKGDYIFFMDSDDYIEENVIEELIKKSGNYNIVKVGSKINDEKKEKIIAYDNEYTSEEYIKMIISGNIGGHCWGYLFNKIVIDDLYFDPNTSFMEDTIFMVKCVLKSSKVKVIDSAYYVHVINKFGITCSAVNIEENISGYMYSINSIEDILEKNGIIMTKELALKKLKIIEVEATKQRNIESCIRITQNKKIQKNMEIIRSTIKIPVMYRVFVKSIIEQKPKLLLVYSKTRALVKKIISYL